MKRIFVFVFLWLSISFTTTAQYDSLYQKAWIAVGTSKMPYRILFPENYNPNKTYPVVFFLHGSGERGADNALQLAHGADLFLKNGNREKYPVFVVFPQCAEFDTWSNVVRLSGPAGNTQQFYFQSVNSAPTVAMEVLMSLVHYIIDAYPIKKDQVYVGGLSMGGMGVFELVSRMPGVFAAAFPICGGASPLLANNNTKKVSWWVFHGAKDDVVDPHLSKQIVDALKKKGANVRYTVFPDANHNSWDPAFAEPQLLPWLFSQRNK